MGFVVKNTTKCELLDLMCPHSCRGCGRLGTVLCERCKKYLFERQERICPICKKTFAKSAENVRRASNVLKNEKSLNNYAESGAKGWRCPDCVIPFEGLWAFGWREGVLEKMVEEYKYKSVRAMGAVLAELLDFVVPRDFGESESVVVVPLPTIGKHVRARGIDHTFEIAKKLANRRGWKCERCLVRAVDTVQVGAKVAERKAQAQRAYAVKGELDDSKVYLLLDDVWTTGATMMAAEKVMREAGAKRISAAVLAISR